MKNKIISFLFGTLVIFSIYGCKTRQYIEVPVEVEKIKTEYIHTIDSIYLHDSVFTSILQKNDTVYINKYKYQTREVFKSDTVHVVDSIPKIVTLTKTVEVNKVSTLQKILIYIGIIGLLTLLIFIIRKIFIWKLPS